jgi:hypothetical protein
VAEPVRPGTEHQARWLHAARQQDHPPSRGAPLGIPRRITGRRVRVDLGLVFSTSHRHLDIALYGYLQTLGGHDDDKVPGVDHLAVRFAVSESTVKRALARLRAAGDLHPPYIQRGRRRRGQTAATRTRHPHVHVQVPFDLLHDVVHRVLTPADLRVWCVLQDRTDVEGLVTVTVGQVLDELDSANTSNTSASWVTVSVQRLERAGWLVVARRPGHRQLLAVPLTRLDIDRRRDVAAVILARHGHHPEPPPDRSPPTTQAAAAHPPPPRRRVPRWTEPGAGSLSTPLTEMTSQAE